MAEPLSKTSRPTDWSSTVREEACRALLPDYQGWSGARSADDLALLVRCASHNGYEFARKLEDLGGISPDGDLVEILESFSAHVWTARRDATRAWVHENSITVPFALGDRVVHKRYGLGVVREINAAEAVVTMLPDAHAPRFETGGGYLVGSEELTTEPVVEAST